LSASSKFGVYIPQDLAKDLEECMKFLGIQSKSKFIQESIRAFISEHKWRLHGRAVGVISLIYNHHIKGADERLTDVQHDFIDIIVGTLHVHLSKDLCLLVIIVRGSTDKIKKFVGSVMNIRGVKLVRQALIPEDLR